MKYILKIDFRGLAVQNSQPILACLIKRKFGRQLLQALRQVTKGIETARAECKDEYAKKQEESPAEGIACDFVDSLYCD